MSISAMNRPLCWSIRMTLTGRSDLLDRNSNHGFNLKQARVHRVGGDKAGLAGGTTQSHVWYGAITDLVPRGQSTNPPLRTESDIMLLESEN